MFLVDVTVRQIFKYSLLPEVSPRVKNMIASGFGNLAFFMALVYRAVNLLPENHHFLRGESMGTFGIRDVLSEASSNLVFDVKHIDQIIIFFALIAGIIMLGIQFIFLSAFFLINPATAQTMPENYGEFVIQDNKSEDIALRMLDAVFGVPDMFGSKEPTDMPFHKALHGLFEFYSTGLLVIAVMIVIYFVFAILAETAQTGTPFGKRYNHVWAPIRLVAAIGLLIPIGTGLNAGQWITLYAAKFGSGFATNGWVKFNETLSDTAIPAEELAARPTIPELRDIAAFMMIGHACKEAYKELRVEGADEIDAWILSEEEGVLPSQISSVSYAFAVAYANTNRERIHIRIGRQNGAYASSKNNVFPFCGDVTLLVTEDPIAMVGDFTDEVVLQLGGHINGAYYELIKEMWTTDYAGMQTTAREMVVRRLSHETLQDPGQELQKQIVEQAKEAIDEAVDKAIEDMQDAFEPDETYKKYGWGGAGIWYNKIAEANGSVTTAAINKPQITTYPFVMEYACQQNMQQNSDTDPEDCYNPRLAQQRDMQFVDVRNREIAKPLSDVYDYWYKAPRDQAGNVFIDVVNAILGTQGLFDMCKNADVHPLAQLSSVGKGLVEAAIRNLGFALGTGAAGILAPYFGPALQSASSFFVTVAGIGILIGFILYYIVPFLPFLYFLFAVGGWVKGIFEAMVGVPLWALAHIRIDGQGLPGDAAINGYFLIFEIFIRPILIVFGLLASILIFGAMVKVLNEVFYLVVSNLSGFDAGVTTSCGADAPAGGGSTAPAGSLEYFRGPVDEFFFTIVYAIIVYMIGMSSFKLIDLIPNNILRWMGAGVSTFNDQAGEPAEGLLSKMAIGGSMMGQQLQGAASQFGTAASHAKNIPGELGGGSRPPG